MGLFDKLKEQAGDLVQGAKDKVGEATGVDVDQTLEAAGSAVEGGDHLIEAADSFTETKDKLIGG